MSIPIKTEREIEKMRLACRAASDVIVVGFVREGRSRHNAHVRAQRAQKIDLLLGLIVGDDDDRAIAARIAQQRKRDAGVSGRALHNGSAALQRSRALRRFDYRLGRTVFDGAARVQKFRLAEDRPAERRR